MARTGVRADPKPEPPPLPAHVLRSKVSHPVPKPPAWLTRAAALEWRKLWTAPESALWTIGDHATAAALAMAIADLQFQPPGSPVFMQMAQLADRLMLNPRARRLARVMVNDKLADELDGIETAASAIADTTDRRSAILRLAESA